MLSKLATLGAMLITLLLATGTVAAFLLIGYILLGGLLRR